MDDAKRRRAVAITALALPGIILVLVLGILMTRGEPESACPELDVPLGDIVEGPRGWTARGRYEQWTTGGPCLGSLGVSFFAPGESWEAEAWSPAAHVVVRQALLPPPSRQRAWLAWGEDGRPLLFGFGTAATPIVVDAMPDAAEGAAFRRCPVAENLLDAAGAVDWPLVNELVSDDAACVPLPLGED